MIKRARVLLALILLGSLALLAVGCASDGESNRDALNANGNRSGNSNDSGDADRKFVTEAAIGGMAEVRLGQIAAQKAMDDEVKQFGQRMVDDHSRANGELKQIASRKGLTLPTELDPIHLEIVDRLSNLAGPDFDRAYMGEMVKDHTRDVSDFERASIVAQDADVKSFAGKTLPTLREHLEMAQALHSRVSATSKPSLRRLPNSNSQ